jgi:protein tyrosine phosphatase
MEKEENIINNCLIKRDFIVRIVGMEKRVSQLQMLNWPDHSIPEDENGYNTLEIILKLIQDYRTNYGFYPILTHCRYKLII